jgi:hypothetical protein
MYTTQKNSIEAFICIIVLELETKFHTRMKQVKLCLKICMLYCQRN